LPRVQHAGIIERLETGSPLSSSPGIAVRRTASLPLAYVSPVHVFLVLLPQRRGCPDASAVIARSAINSFLAAPWIASLTLAMTILKMDDEWNERSSRQANPRLPLACKQQSHLALSMPVSAFIGIGRIKRARIEICQQIAAEPGGGLKEKDPASRLGPFAPRHEHWTRSFGLLAHSFGFYLATAIASLTFPSRTIGRIGSTHLCRAMTPRGALGEGTRKRTRDRDDENSNRQDRKKNLHFNLQ